MVLSIIVRPISRFVLVGLSTNVTQQHNFFSAMSMPFTIPKNVKNSKMSKNTKIFMCVSCCQKEPLNYYIIWLHSHSRQNRSKMNRSHILKIYTVGSCLSHSHFVLFSSVLFTTVTTQNNSRNEYLHHFSIHIDS